MSTPFYQKARRHLGRKCPTLKAVIARVGPCTLVPKPDDPLTLLVRCVISQQISTKAAESISARLLAAIDGPPVNRETLAKMTPDEFKGCGVSGPKQRTLLAVCEHVAANPDLLPGFTTWDDDTLRERLTAIKGIGPWTVDMLLIFGLGRPDVLPVGDLGLKMAVRNQYGFKELPTAAEMIERAESWQPYRSIATWYLWRSLSLPAAKPEEKAVKPKAGKKK